MATATVYWIDWAMQSALTTSAPVSTTRIDVLNDTLQCTLHSGAFVGATARRTLRFWSDVSASELATGGNYTQSAANGATGGFQLASKTFAYNSSTGTFTFNAGTVTYSNTTLSGVTFAVISDRTAGSANSARPLLAVVDFGGAQSTNNGDFVIAWAAGGITTLTFP